LDPRGFCGQTRLVIVAGKGGVGKTTIAAALARVAARNGLSALIIEVSDPDALASCLGVSSEVLGYEEEVVVAGAHRGEADVRARVLAPDAALVDYLEEHGMGRLSRRLARSGVMEVVATAVPGIKDILVLGKVKQLERANAADLIILDAPAAGHAVTFLLSARGLLDAMRVGPVRNQAQEVTDMLADPRRCQVLLVTLPEETPVNETIETAFALEDRVGLHLGPVIVNGMYGDSAIAGTDPAEAAAGAGVTIDSREATALRDAAALREHRRGQQAEQVSRLNDGLPLPQLHLPFLFATDIGPTEIEILASALEVAVDGLDPGFAPGGLDTEGRIFE